MVVRVAQPRSGQSGVDASPESQPHMSAAGAREPGFREVVSRQHAAVVAARDQVNALQSAA
jgi:hypothetical protein